MRLRKFNNTMFHLTETSTTKQMTPINGAITEEGLLLNNQIGKVLNGFHLCGSRWEFSWKQWETVCNIFLLIRFLLSAALGGNGAQGGETNTWCRRTGWKWWLCWGTAGMRVRIGRRYDDGWSGGLDPCGLCSSTQVNNSEAERLSSEETYFLTSQPARKHVRV